MAKARAVFVVGAEFGKVYDPGHSGELNMAPAFGDA